MTGVTARQGGDAPRGARLGLDALVRPSYLQSAGHGVSDWPN